MPYTKALSSADKLSFDKLLLSMLLEFTAEYDIEKILSLVVNTVPSLIGARQASLFWIDPERRRIVLRSTYPANRHNIGKHWYEIGEGLTGWVAENGRPLRIDNIEDEKELRRINKNLRWADKYSAFKTAVKNERDRQRAYLGIPIKIEGVTMGVLRIAKTEKPNMKFSRQHEELITSFANNLSNIFMKGELLQRVKGFAELMEPIHFTSLEAMDKYFRWVVNFIPPMIGSRGCTIWLKDRKSNSYVLRYASKGNPLEEQIDAANYRKGEGLTGWVLVTGEALKVNNIRDDDELRRIHPNLRWMGKHKESEQASYLAAPIRTPKEIYGVVRMSKHVGNIPFSEDDKEMLIKYGGFLGMSFKHVIDNESGLMLVRPLYNGRFLATEEQCFVLMPYSQPWSENVKNAIRRAVDKRHLTFHIANEDYGRIVVQEIWKGICKAQIIIADLSSANANVAYEVGMADVLGKKIILLAQNPKEVPFDFVGMRLLPYNLDRIDDLEDKLSERIQQLIDDPSY